MPLYAMLIEILVSWIPSIALSTSMYVRFPREPVAMTSLLEARCTKKLPQGCGLKLGTKFQFDSKVEFFVTKKKPQKVISALHIPRSILSSAIHDA
jgi:hypothetical protein